VIILRLTDGNEPSGRSTWGRLIFFQLLNQFEQLGDEFILPILKSLLDEGALQADDNFPIHAAMVEFSHGRDLGAKAIRQAD
jgi:hypothetical protein